MAIHLIIRNSRAHEFFFKSLEIYRPHKQIARHKRVYSAHELHSTTSMNKQDQCPYPKKKEKGSFFWCVGGGGTLYYIVIIIAN